MQKLRKEERLAWGPAWQDTGWLFVREDGSPIHPDRLSKMFAARVKAAGKWSDDWGARCPTCGRGKQDHALPTIRLHDLRHTHATLLLQAGTHVKIVSERLGHSSAMLTLDVYSHLLPSLGEDAAGAVAKLVDGVS